MPIRTGKNIYHGRVSVIVAVGRTNWLLTFRDLYWCGCGEELTKCQGQFLVYRNCTSDYIWSCGVTITIQGWSYYRMLSLQTFLSVLLSLRYLEQIHCSCYYGPSLSFK